MKGVSGGYGDSNLSQGSKEVLIFDDVDGVSDFAVQKWVEISHEALKSKGRFEIALSGGKTPVNLYKKLSACKKPLPWNKTYAFMVDERFVFHEDAESNYRMINQTLLKHIKIPEEHIHSIPVEEKTPLASAKKYEEDLISYFKLARGKFPIFDLIVLGIGEDGHTASLFPDAPALTEACHLAVAVSSPDMSQIERITLTFPVINNAKNIIFLITGSNKAEIVKEVIEGGNSALPAAMVKPKKGKMFFLLDKSAASHLK